MHAGRRIPARGQPLSASPGFTPAGGERPPGARAGWALLRDPAFFRVWLTGGFTGVMRWLEVLAVAIYTLEVTGSALSVALMLFARQAPTAVLGVFAGALAERVDRRTLLAGGLAVMTANATVLAILAVTGRIELWHIATGAVVSGIFWSGEFPVRRTLLADAASHGLIGRAMAIDSATNNATRMAGPLLGGVIMTWLGLEGAYLAGIALYAAAFINVIRLEPSPRHSPIHRQGILLIVREGFAFIRGEPLVAGTLAVTLIANLFGFAFASMVPVIGERTLGLDPVGIGALMATEGAGALIGALLIASLVRPVHYVRLYVRGTALFLVMVLAFAHSAWFVVSLSLLLVAGLGMAGFAAMQTTLILSRAGEEMRARLMGVMVLCIGAGPIGVLHIGWLAEHIGATGAVALTAAEGLVALGICLWIWPELRERGSGQPAGRKTGR